MLATAIVNVNSGSMARSLLDSGSELNFVTEDLAQKLKLKRFRAS